MGVGSQCHWTTGVTNFLAKIQRFRKLSFTFRPKFDLTDVSFHYFIRLCNPPIVLFQHLDPSVQSSHLHPQLPVRSSNFTDF
jgi:hypothetical protein